VAAVAAALTILAVAEVVAVVELTLLEEEELVAVVAV
jgi:hypothetical protein